MRVARWASPEERRRIINQQAAEFEARNPDLVPALVAIAQQFLDAGKTRISFRLAWEVLRFQKTLKLSGPGTYALNDNYWEHFRNRLVEELPAVASRLERRTRRSR